MTERQKSQNELDQELSDAMLARQLQAEMMQESEAAAQQRAPLTAPVGGPAAAGNAAEPPAPAATAGEVKVDCPACTFTNVLHHIEPNKVYKCQQCLTPLPVVAPRRASRQQKSHGDAHHYVVCEACQSVNKIPHQKADAMLCGTCYQKLNLSDTPAHQPAPQRQQSQPQHAGDAEQGERSVQVVCGKCNTVNAVHINANVKQVHFMCGKCNTVNEITL